MFYRLFCLVVLASLVAPVQATLMRLDFSGTVIGSLPLVGDSPTGEFSGYYLLDTSISDTNDSPTFGRYNQAVIGGSLNWRGDQYDLSEGLLSAGVNNDSGNPNNDLFYIVTVNPGVFAFTIQLGDPTEMAFSDDSFPTELNFLDFAPLEIDNINSTGAFFSPVGAQLSIEQGSFDFIQYTAVPIPGALILFSSGVMGLFACSRRRSQCLSG